MKYFFFLVLALLLSIQQGVYGQQQQAVADQAQKQIITFVPEMVYPMGMRPRQATSGFMLRLSPDSLVCYLPYFGRATSIDYGSGKSSTDFISTKFDYVKSKGKKGATTILLTPKDNGELRTINITYYTGSDYAHIAITFNRQQSISYRGRITLADGRK